jgi:type I restriction enzyme M protein
MAKQMGLNMKETKNGNSANLGFEAKLWIAADKMRNNMDAAEYKHVVLGLIFLKYISDAFAEVYLELKNDPEKLSNPEDKDEYKAKNVFWVPPQARWDKLQTRVERETNETSERAFSV